MRRLSISLFACIVAAPCFAVGEGNDPAVWIVCAVKSALQNLSNLPVKQQRGTPALPPRNGKKPVVQQRGTPALPPRNDKKPVVQQRGTPALPPRNENKPVIQQRGTPALPPRNDKKPVVQQRGTPALPPRNASTLPNPVQVNAVSSAPVAQQVTEQSQPAPVTGNLPTQVGRMIARVQEAQVETSDDGSEWDGEPLSCDENPKRDRAEILTRRTAAPVAVASAEQQRQAQAQEAAQADLMRNVLMARRSAMQGDDESNDATWSE